jgi:hypothetical protein
MSKKQFIFIPAVVIAIVNFAACFIINISIGGDAINGHVTDGHYFLGSHGRYIEVSRAVWTYSYYHTVSMWITHLSVFILAAIFLNTGDMKIEKR